MIKIPSLRARLPVGRERSNRELCINADLALPLCPAYRTLAPVIDVTCALILDRENKLLVTQRSSSMSLPLKWEFPGGKIEPNETAEQCLIREIKEELNIDIELIAPLAPNIHTYPSITIQLIPFVCRLVDGEVLLKEHARYQWLQPDQLLSLDWAEADVPIVRSYLSESGFTEF